jgi:hypothetical protein
MTAPRLVISYPPLATEAECKPDPANEITIVPPFCMAPG